MTLVSISSSQKFDECHRAWFYSSSTWGLGYSPIYEGDAKVLGALFHVVMAHITLGSARDEAVSQVSDTQTSLWERYGRPNDAQDILDKLDGLTLAHVKWQGRDAGYYSDANLETIEVEKSIKVEAGGVTFTFKCDRIVRHKPSGVLLPFEYKTSRYPEQVEAGLPWDLQNRFYPWAVSQVYGERVPGVLYEFVRAVNPNKVQILKNGLPSQGMNALSSTTFEIYYDTLLACANEVMQRPKPGYKSVNEIMVTYNQTLDKFLDRVDPVFWRRPFWVSSALQDEAVKGMIEAAGEMEAARILGADVRPTGLNRSACNAWGGCPYKQPCLVHSQGGDYVGALEQDFIKGKERI